eukprot:TRINITY_DN12081_c0_g1_i1.p1 TRINITY_DN12081_c0_g1~~TRINITY_DN12081_c0_g1_i1.p1  ORF type:complete len:230 (-),score=29.85 TRINITY_DN12081_c0_g1_i1:95-784(-)
MNPQLYLPQEIFSYLLSFLDEKDILQNVALVQKRWHNVTNMNYLWWMLCLKRWPLYGSSAGDSWVEEYKKRSKLWNWSNFPSSVDCEKNGMKVTKRDQGGDVEGRYAVIIGSKNFRKGRGIFCWQIEILETQKDFLTIGVCEEMERCNDEIPSFGFTGDFIWQRGIPFLCPSSRRFENGDIIEVRLDMDRLQIHFGFNGREFKIDRLPESLFAFVALDDIFESIRLKFH